MIKYQDRHLSMPLQGRHLRKTPHGQHYVGKVRTMRNEIRTQRLMNSLPADIRKDIGWPDMYAERRSHGN